jgi:hypothetical protein
LLFCSQHQFFLAPPVIVRQSVPSIVVHSSSELVIFCGANGFPAASYTWNRNGEFFFSTSTVTSFSTSLPQSGVYECIASNPAGIAISSPINVTVVGLNIVLDILIITIKHFS